MKKIVSIFFKIFEVCTSLESCLTTSWFHRIFSKISIQFLYFLKIAQKCIQYFKNIFQYYSEVSLQFFQILQQVIQTYLEICQNFLFDYSSKIFSKFSYVLHNVHQNFFTTTQFYLNL